MKVHELAKKLNKSNSEVIKLTGATSHLSTVDPDIETELLKASISSESFLERMDREAAENKAKREAAKVEVEPIKENLIPMSEVERLIADAVKEALAAKPEYSTPAPVEKIDMQGCPISLEELELAIRCNGAKSPYWKWNLLLKK